MKRLALIITSFAALLSAGCATNTGRNFAAFAAALPAVTATDITQTTTTPVYSHSESASGIATSPTGLLTITNGKASATIPELGVQWSFAVSGLQMQASPSQVAAAAQLTAAPSASAPATK